MDGDMEALNPDLDMAAADDDAVKELDEMKKQLKEMEDEAAALREMQAKVEKEMAAQDNIGSHEKQEQRDSHFQPPIPPGRNYESFPATNILLFCWMASTMIFPNNRFTRLWWRRW